MKALSFLVKDEFSTVGNTVVPESRETVSD
jgi:hypothetical protein